MEDEVIVILDDDSDLIPEDEPESEPEVQAEVKPIKEEAKMEKAPKVTLRNRSKSMLCANLMEKDKKGRSKGVIWGPLGKDDCRDVDPAELEGKEIRKLLALKKLEIRR